MVIQSSPFPIRTVVACSNPHRNYNLLTKYSLSYTEYGCFAVIVSCQYCARCTLTISWLLIALATSFALRELSFTVFSCPTRLLCCFDFVWFEWIALAVASFLRLIETQPLRPRGRKNDEKGEALCDMNVLCVRVCRCGHLFECPARRTCRTRNNEQQK